jgi:hypothetical protein
VSLHHRLRSVLSNTDDFDAESLSRIYQTVAHRLGAMCEADELRSNMGIQFRSIFEFDVDQYVSDEFARARAENSGRYFELNNRVLQLMCDNCLLHYPGHGYCSYSKPKKYLSIALIESGMDWNEIEAKVTMAASGM